MFFFFYSCILKVQYRKRRGCTDEPLTYVYLKKKMVHFPKGPWVLSARNVTVLGKLVTCELRNVAGEFIPCQFTFQPSLMYENIDGVIQSSVDDSQFIPLGSWIDTAKDVKIKNETVSCLLETETGEWVHNIFRFYRHLKYVNVDGRIQWENCFNGVQLGDCSHDSILRRYPPVSVETCLSKKPLSGYSNWFKIKDKYVQRQSLECISVSLFRKNVNNRYDDQYPVDPNYWNTKYMIPLMKNLEWFPFDDMCVNVYLAHDMEYVIPELTRFKCVNVYLMESDSVGAQPGMMWRFLDITNKSYRAVYVVDIDEDWEHLDMLKAFMKPGMNAKLYSLTPGDSIISRNPFQPAISYSTILGGRIKANPSKFDWDIADVMLGFITVCVERNFSHCPIRFDDSDPITYWNQPVVEWEGSVMGGSPFGWGRLETVYGFDELFLKHVLYYDAYPDFHFY